MTPSAFDVGSNSPAAAVTSSNVPLPLLRYSHDVAPGIGLGRAVRLRLAVGAAEHVGLRRPPDVVADQQIEQAVAVVVDPRRRGAEAGAAAEPGALGHVGEPAVAAVPEQAALADAGDDDVLVAVVVEVGGGRAHGVHRDAQSGLGRDVLEAGGAGIAEQPQRRVRARRVVGEAGAAQQQDVLAPVAVGVEDRGAGPERLGQILAARRARRVLEAQAARQS